MVSPNAVSKKSPGRMPYKGERSSNMSKRKMSKVIFSIYMILLFDVVVIKYFGSIRIVRNRVESMITNRREYGCLNLNLVPFKSIESAIHSFDRYGFNSINVLNLAANLVLFVPMGFLLPLLISNPSFTRTIAISAMIIVGFEAIQFFAFLGVADVDDLIINLAGCTIGFLLYAMTRRLANLKKSRRLNS